MEQKPNPVSGGGQSQQGGRQPPAYDPNNGGHFGKLFALIHLATDLATVANYVRWEYLREVKLTFRDDESRCECCCMFTLFSMPKKIRVSETYKDRDMEWCEEVLIRRCTVSRTGLCASAGVVSGDMGECMYMNPSFHLIMTDAITLTM